MAPHGRHAWHQLPSPAQTPCVRLGEPFPLSGPSFPSCGLRLPGGPPFRAHVGNRAKLSSLRGGEARVLAVLPSCREPGLPGAPRRQAGWHVRAFWRLHTCTLRPPLGVLRREWLLGLGSLMTGVSEELVAQDRPSFPTPPHFGAVVEESPECHWAMVILSRTGLFPHKRLPPVLPSSCANRHAWASPALMGGRGFSPGSATASWPLPVDLWPVGFKGATPSLCSPGVDLACLLHRVGPGSGGPQTSRQKRIAG